MLINDARVYQTTHDVIANFSRIATRVANYIVFIDRLHEWNSWKETSSIRAWEEKSSGGLIQEQMRCRFSNPNRASENFDRGIFIGVVQHESKGRKNDNVRAFVKN
jgi:hypothetical protein